jgi:hypothetical protein
MKKIKIKKLKNHFIMKNMKNYLFFVAILIIAFLTWKTCSSTKEVSTQDLFTSLTDSTQLKNLKDSLILVKLDNDSKRAEINLVQASLNEKSEMISKLSDKNHQLKGQLVMANKFNLNFKIDSSKITTTNDPNAHFVLPNLEDSLIQNSIYPPTNWKLNYADSGLIVNVFGSTVNNQVLGDSINLAINGILGITKLNSNQLKAYFYSQSPMLQNMNLESYLYTIPKEKVKKFSVGPQIGVGLNTSGQFKPYLGIGIQYSLFQF